MWIRIDPAAPLSTGWADSLPLSVVISVYRSDGTRIINHSISETIVMRSPASVGQALPDLTLASFTTDRVIGNVNRVFSTTGYDTGQSDIDSAVSSSALIRPRVQSDTGHILATTGGGQAFGNLTLSRVSRASSEIIPALADTSASSTSRIDIAAPGVIPDIPPPDLPIPAATGAVTERSPPDLSLLDWDQSRTFRLDDLFIFDNSHRGRLIVETPGIMPDAVIGIALTNSTASTLSDGTRVWDFAPTTASELTISFDTSAFTATSAADLNPFNLIFDFGGDSIFRYKFIMRVIDSSIHAVNAIPNREMGIGTTASVELGDVFTSQPSPGASRALTVASRNSSRATGSISGTTLSITAGSEAGIVDLVITATDTPDPRFASAIDPRLSLIHI